MENKECHLIRLVVGEDTDDSEEDLKAVTTLTVTISGGTIKGATNDSKTFTGTGASGFGTGVGILNKINNDIYDNTSSYELFARTAGIQIIHFKSPEGAVTGTWSGAIVRPVPASKGSGKFTPN